MRSLRRCLGLPFAVFLGVLPPVGAYPVWALRHEDELRGARAEAVEAWTADLDRLVREIGYRHPNPEHFGPRWEDFLADAEALRGRFPALPEWRIPWELSRLVATLREGHTWVDPFSLPAMGRRVPLRFGFYEEGLFVVGARAPHEELLGARVLTIAGIDPWELLDRARELRLTSADNEMSLRWWTAWHLGMPTAVALLSDSEVPGPVDYLLEGEGGERHALRLDAESKARGPRRDLPRMDGSLASEEHGEDLYYVEVMEEARALYWRYDGFREDEHLPWEAFCRAAFASFEGEDLERLILDLRGNGGGNPDYGIPLLRGILRQAALDEENALVVLIGPGTDSAAVSFCAVLEELADPVFVGMPTFLRPNGHADAYSLKLPRSGLEAHVSTMYWRAAHPEDRRPWIAPHVAVPVRFEDVHAGRDRALELALAGVEPTSPQTFEPELRPGHAAEDLLSALEAWRAAPEQRWAEVEWDINGLGYELLARNRLDDALEVFALNMRLHPDAWNVYDSYGETLLHMGDEEGALQAYRESVRRFPGNVAAIETILELEERLEPR